MTDKTITLTSEEYRVCMTAMVRYNLQGYPLEQRVGWREREAWQRLAKQTYDKIYEEYKKEEVKQ